jgi:hypothetical protein
MLCLLDFFSLSLLHQKTAVWCKKSQNRVSTGFYGENVQSKCRLITAVDQTAIDSYSKCESIVKEKGLNFFELQQFLSTYKMACFSTFFLKSNGEVKNSKVSSETPN